MAEPVRVALVYEAEVVPYVRVGRERFTRRASRYLASKDALALALRNAARFSGVTEADAAGSWSLYLTVERRTARRFDLDNVVKAVADAANGVAWADDVQLDELMAYKVRRPAGQPARDRLFVLLSRQPEPKEG